MGFKMIIAGFLVGARRPSACGSVVACAGRLRYATGRLDRTDAMSYRDTWGGPGSAATTDRGTMIAWRQRWNVLMETLFSESAKKKWLLPVIAIVLLITSILNSICFKKMTNKMPNYPFFLMEVATVMYIPVCMVVVYVLKWTNNFDPSNYEFPKRKFAVIALLDGAGGLFTLFGGVHTKGTTQMLLGQGSIPVTMALSFSFLHTRYEWMQYCGALVILSGVFVVLSPKLFGPPDSGVEMGSDLVLFNIIFFLSCIPNSLSNVYKEHAFKDWAKIDPWYTMLWVGWFQTIISLLFLPFNSLSFLGSSALPLNELPSAIRDGFKCALGVNSVVSHCYYATPFPGEMPCDTCEGAWKTLTVYAVINIAFNLMTLLMLKEGSASLLIILMTLRLPLGNMAFYMPFVMGNDAQPFDFHDISGLVVILMGLVIYRYQRAPESEDPDAPYVVTSTYLIMPGVSEPIVNQVQRRPVNMRRSSEGIRGQLYTRLGMKPSQHYADPRDIEYGSPEKSVLLDESASSSQQRRPYGSIRMSPHANVGKASVPIGVSPVARSAPLYQALMARSAGSQGAATPLQGTSLLRNQVQSDDSDDDEYTDEEEQSGQPEAR
ncbi:Crt-like 1 [Porphyridium purpureum]|uniref:Crt-like 1 n=1 Tax=Porphyridium purpureum TaxID=35688 RepID=A0A5J4YVN9_PORPP|nr:Crt-like 1 [Porphyridium purpureum]|eukprot:POR9520..scf227_4